jgi:hypothetical protein
LYRDGIGDLSVLGDKRWAGGYGIDADFIALENTHVAFVETREIKARMKSRLWCKAAARGNYKTV